MASFHHSESVGVIKRVSIGEPAPELMPLISVVTVCFNAERTIAQTIASVLAQRWPCIEYIVVDGQSQDDTVGVARRTGGDRIRLISEPDAGIYDAMNKGIRAATGDIIAFLNADDFYCNDMVLTRIAHEFMERDVDAVFGNLNYVSADGDRIVRKWRSRPFRPGAFARGWVPPHPAFFARRHLFERFGGFDLRYRIAGDFDLMNRFFTRGGIRSHHIAATMVHMRVGGLSNASWRTVMRAQGECLRSLVGTFGFVPPMYFILKITDRLRQMSRAFS